jgi:hypothetical protein
VSGPNQTCPIRDGEGDMDNRRQLTFGQAMDRALMWMIAALVSWLCYSTMNLQKQMAVMSERSDNTHFDMQRLSAGVQLMDSRIQIIEVKQAQHGWK